MCDSTSEKKTIPNSHIAQRIQLEYTGRQHTVTMGAGKKKEIHGQSFIITKKTHNARSLHHAQCTISQRTMIKKSNINNEIRNANGVAMSLPPRASVLHRFELQATGAERNHCCHRTLSTLCKRCPGKFVLCAHDEKSVATNWAQLPSILSVFRSHRPPVPMHPCENESLRFPTHYAQPASVTLLSREQCTRIRADTHGHLLLLHAVRSN